MAPAIATELVDRLGPESPGYYITIIASIALFGLLCIAPRSPVHFSVINQGEDSNDLNFELNEEDDEHDYSEDGDRELI